MKNALLALILTIASTSALAAGNEICYELSNVRDSWSRTPQVLCKTGPNSNDKYEFSLEHRNIGGREVVATFEFNNILAARCLDCNRNVYGIRNPSNSVFNALKISFSGKRDIRAGTESGAITIGDTKFFYRKY
jgi:hypothetical protein